MTHHRGFTMKDLLICIGIALVLIVVVLPNLRTRTHEGAGKIKCASNLKQIGLAIRMYADDEVRNGHAYPRTRYVDGAPPVIGTANPRGWNDDDSPLNHAKANSFEPDRGAPDPNDVTGALFLVIRTQEISPDTFVCPSSDQDRWLMDENDTVHWYTNWTTGWTQRRSIGRALSYAYANPYGSSAAIKNGFTFTDSMTAEFALMADIGPGNASALKLTVRSPTTLVRESNSPNHDFDGQNVLYADGHVDWSTSPLVGVQKDNIYAYRASGADPTGESAGFYGSPRDENDSVMLPHWQPGRPLILTSTGRTTVNPFAVAAIIMATVALAIGIGFLCLRKKTPPLPPVPAPVPPADVPTDPGAPV